MAAILSTGRWVNGYLNDTDAIIWSYPSATKNHEQYMVTATPRISGPRIYGNLALRTHFDSNGIYYIIPVLA